MFDAQSHQADLPHHAEPVLSVAIITKKRNELFAVSNPIMTKPKPAPAAAPAANDTKTKSEESSSKDGTPMEQEEDAPESSTPKEEEKMEVWVYWYGYWCVSQERKRSHLNRFITAASKIWGSEFTSKVVELCDVYEKLIF